MASWRTLLTPNTEKNIGSLIFNDNSRILNDDSQIREIKPSDSKNMMIVSKIVHEAKKEDANKNLNYQQKLELLQKEIVALKRQNKENYNPNNNFENLAEIRSSRHKEVIETSQEIRSFHMNSEVKIFKKKGRKNSLHEEMNGARIKKKGSPSFMNFADLGLNLKNEISDHSAKISQNQCPSEFSEQRSLESDCSVNLIQLVHKYQKSLKKEKKKTQGLNRKMSTLLKENFALKKTLKEHNLLEQYKEKEKENKNHLQKMQDILFKKKEQENIMEVSNVTENKNFLDRNEETIKDLMATKTDLVSALEKILSMFTTKSQKESFCSSKKEKIEGVLKDYENSKRRFFQKNELLKGKYENAEIFNSNERRKIQGKEFLSPTYMETTNNLNYTPSNEGGVRSFFSNLKSSKAAK